MKLELQPTQGLTVSDLRYEKTKVHTLVHSKPASAYNSLAFPIRFKLRADRNAGLGLHTLNGKLTVEVLDYRTGVSTPRQVDVLIPVTVVEHGAKVQKRKGPFKKNPSGMIVLMIVLSPVIVAVVIPIMAICAITRGTAACE